MSGGIDYAKLKPDHKSVEPLHVQLYQALVREIRALPPGSDTILMSERELSALLKLGRCTTHRAYEQLLADRLVRRLPDKSLAVRRDARVKIRGAYPVIGVLIALNFTDLLHLRSNNIQPYLNGLIGRCSKSNISCIMLRVPEPTASEEEIDSFAAEHFPRLCGVIHLGALCRDTSCKDPVLRRLLSHTEIPQVCLAGSVPSPHTGSVYADPAPGLDDMCRTMKKRGFRSVGIVGRLIENSFFHYDSLDREDAMRSALERNGLKCRLVGKLRNEDCETEIHRILTSPDRPDVLLCHDDRLAYQVMDQATALGLSIPGDLALAGYDCRSEDTFLASIRTFPYQIAETAVDMVMDHFENGVSKKNRTVILKTSFSDGNSLQRKE
ncbi:MAG: substrate-binding domain-containing protein [Lentisphaeria bacterium]|nr:substrate-binding domain-containing protein [Lentisphaeria bacterium]